MSSAIISFENVTKAFGAINAVSDLTFSVNEGEFVFLTGPSGAGKSTVLKLILSEIKPSSGKILFDGVEVNKLKSRDVPKLRQKIGFVFQDFKLLVDRTVRENVEIALAVIGTQQSAWHDRVERVLELVGLVDRADLFPSQLSGGEIQRTSIARALVVNPKVVLADEPTGNLDWDTADAIVDLFSKINKEGKTIVFATHHKVIVNKLKKRVIKLNSGRMEKG